MKHNALTIRDLHIAIEDKQIVKGVDLTIKNSELHVIMGPNGSGKSTLTQGLMGNPAYEVKAKKMALDTKNLLDMKPEDRAKAGIMLTFQTPIAVPGVTLGNLLKTAYQELHQEKNFSVVDFYKQLKKQAAYLNLDESFLKRAIHDGFSGGEKKKVEILQLLVLKPKFVLLDEIDTGLDVDALKLVSKAIRTLQDQGVGILLITHYQRILAYLKPDHVHILKSGKIIKSGSESLVKLIEEKGYGSI
ncbi:Fe-S cluster assembly ATPase SufC [Candidatus Microgenomates bacterium]|nr:MAG: Fe-S cluster assembly ATPase SufC [Candidatus Microgenomates bacterium]